MITWRYLILGTLLITVIGEAKAQDPHFSQYFASPLVLNPANTGNFAGPNRVTTHYRHQWLGVGDPFITGLVAFEASAFRKYIGEDDKIGIGFMGMYDKAALGSFKSTYAAASLSYLKVIDENGYQRIGIGFQPVLANRYLDFNKISFANQFTADGFNLAAPSGESFKTSNLMYFDFNAGMVYTFENERNTYYAGASFYHITRPRISFLGDTAYNLPARLTIHSGASFEQGANGRVFVSALAMKQAQATELTVGVSYGYFLPGTNYETAVIGGLWHRLNDAVYPYIGILHNGFQFGFTYDITTSSMTMSNTRNSSFEASCVFLLRDRKAMKRWIPWY